MTALTIHDYAAVNSVAGSVYNADSLHKLRNSLNSSTAMPTFSKLFKNLENRHRVDENESIFSPAAYFADLVRLVQNHTGLKEDDAKNLFVRRADLLEIPLDAEHTTTEAPYLEVVNGILADLINRVEGRESSGRGAAIRDLASATFPARLPYYEPIERLSAYFEQMKTPLSEVMGTYGYAETQRKFSVLGIYGPEANRIRKPDFSLVGLAERFGVAPLSVEKIVIRHFEESQTLGHPEANSIYFDIFESSDEILVSYIGDHAFVGEPRNLNWRDDSERGREFAKKAKPILQDFEKLDTGEDQVVTVTDFGPRERRILDLLTIDSVMVDELQYVDRLASQLEIDPAEIADVVSQKPFGFEKGRTGIPRGIALFFNRTLTNEILKHSSNTKEGDTFHVRIADGNRLCLFRMRTYDGEAGKAASERRSGCATPTIWPQTPRCARGSPSI